MQDAIEVREVRIGYRGPRRCGAALREPQGVAELVRRLVNGDPREHFVAVFLNGRHEPVAFQVVSIGTATASLVHPREVYQPAVALGACAVILAHNHPSGNVEPSVEDRSVMERLARAGELLGIALLDSVIVTADGHRSMRESEPRLFAAARDGVN